MMRKDGEWAGPGQDRYGLYMGGPPFSWSEIEECLSKDPKPMFEKRGLEARDCDYCQTPCELIWWTSSPETWEMLCGRAGYVEVCKSCRAWYELNNGIIS